MNNVYKCHNMSEFHNNYADEKKYFVYYDFIICVPEKPN